MKIVLDTNSLIDASGDDYNFGNRIIDEVISGKIQAFANRATLAENRLMAGRKITDLDYLEKLNQYFDAVHLVETEERLDVVEDPEDNKILESALASSSEYLVTSDNHLLKLSEYEGVKIISPSGFWQAFNEESGTSWRNWIKDFIN
ncbi:MAG: putative toxin-antitoxin system toxin component, PIN family [Candidatus Doudnabacteria bacterium]|nr:putative toxin-antitoxin system toxin component, PIN family [Candidatus Doudnabacteria bacterium]